MGVRDLLKMDCWVETDVSEKRGSLGYDVKFGSKLRADRAGETGVSSASQRSEQIKLVPESQVEPMASLEPCHFILRLMH